MSEKPGASEASHKDCQSNKPTTPRGLVQAASCAKEAEDHRIQQQTLEQQARAAEASERAVVAAYEQARLYLAQSIFLAWTLVATGCAAYAAFRGVRVAERALIDLERPLLIIDMDDAQGIAQSRDGWEFGDRLKFALVNYGKTAAILKRSKLGGGIARGGMINPIDPDNEAGSPSPVGAVIGPGKTENGLSFGIMAELDLADFPTKARPGSVIFQGFIVYEDLFGNEYTLGFCTAFLGDHWALLGDDRYCYERVKRGIYIRA